MQEISIRALDGSDVIGLLTQSAHDKNFKFSPWNYKIDYWLFYIDEFKEKIGIDINSKVIVDHQLPRSQQMGNINNFKDIIGDTDIHIISCNVPGLKNNKIDEILKVGVSYTQITNIMKYSEREHFINEISNIKESVVLFGTGNMGKDFGIYLRDNYGKICIDMGTTLDAWAGIISKIWFDEGNIQRHCVI
ncbi:MAG: hypothetical protein GTO02_01580 [Candidatus Dadabacteria bacterium]|nr:hypothetical protein [Candidatus Dadabacteria bacterium]